MEEPIAPWELIRFSLKKSIKSLNLVDWKNYIWRNRNVRQGGQAGEIKFGF